MAQFGPMPKPNQAVGLLVCVAVLALGASSAAAAERIPGIDVSRFNETIDWERVGTTPIEFAFVAASRGSGEDCGVAPSQCGADPFYDANYAGATAAGIRVGAYHRAFTNGTGRRQVRRDAQAFFWTRSVTCRPATCRRRSTLKALSTGSSGAV